MDQVDRVLYDLKHNPYSRRIMTNIYVHQDLHEMNLYPCAYSMTFNVTKKPGDDKLVLNAILDMMYGQFYDVLEATSEKQELESHRQIIDAIRRRDTEAAQRLMHEHLQVTMDMLKEN